MAGGTRRPVWVSQDFDARPGVYRLRTGRTVYWIIPAQVSDEGSFGLPPSLAPRTLAWIIVVTGVVLAIQNLGRRQTASGGVKLSDIAYLAACVAAVAIMLIVMKAVGTWAGQPYAGFFAAAPLALIVFTLLHTGAPAWVYAFNAIVAPVTIYVAFWWGLRLPLP